ncbi:MAG: NADH-quinone oxidoreductase subunit J [Bacteroidetes bacterium]|nr:NADH-quinone oxidoreductase subunit J [Bacteroidota bacterium]MBU1115456.1 NADH-quinone oxidoreductase subunit J [Bacteroidota bacterium]MBU1798511.1 NADH-quinone oxidoreductase subunit J [Bacteroidota bacterium]
MSIYDLIFYLFATLTIVSALMVVSSDNIVRSAFYLLATFFGVSGIYVLLGADFVAVTQIMVYIGGILILLLFGVMLTSNITNVEIKKGTAKILPAVIGIGILLGAVVSVMTRTKWKIHLTEIPQTTSFELGKLLITDYVLVFELLGILLLIALIGAASMARREQE